MLPTSVLPPRRGDSKDEGNTLKGNKWDINLLSNESKSKPIIAMFLANFFLIVMVWQLLFSPLVSDLQHSQELLRLQEQRTTQERRLQTEYSHNIQRLEYLNPNFLHYSEMIFVLENFITLARANNLYEVSFTSNEPVMAYVAPIITTRDTSQRLQNIMVMEMRVSAEYSGNLADILHFIRALENEAGYIVSMSLATGDGDMARLNVGFSLFGSEIN